MKSDRRTVLKQVGTGVAIVAGGTGVATARGGRGGRGGGGGGGDGDAKLRAAHAVSDAPAVDVLVNGDVAVAELAFGEVTGYLEVSAAEYDIAINVAGTDTTVFSTSVELSAENFTAAATGNLQAEGDEDGFDLDIFQDKLGVIERDNGRVRVYHLSPDAPAVDVAVAAENDEPAVVLAQDIEFGEAGPDVEVEAGTYPVAVYPADSETPVFGPIDVEVRDGEVLSAFAEGELAPEGDEDGFGPVLATRRLRRSAAVAKLRRNRVGDVVRPCIPGD